MNPSRTQIAKVGDTLRRWRFGELLSDAEVEAAWNILVEYRQLWSQTPLTTTNMGLRSMVKTRNLWGRVTQRLKRVDRIVGKLVRFPEMALSRMEDIGGCRVVVRTLEDLQQLQSRIQDAWSKDIRRVRDYITNPKPTGYRAVHLVVNRKDVLVEIQLRTTMQHRWAMEVERLEFKTRALLKDGKGDPQILRFFQVLGDALAALDERSALDPTLREELERLQNELKGLLS
jgi:ppGpp synthetase/RelA/SpoT-type nucleotidyltranferase